MTTGHLHYSLYRQGLSFPQNQSPAIHHRWWKLPMEQSSQSAVRHQAVADECWAWQHDFYCTNVEEEREIVITSTRCAQHLWLCISQLLFLSLCRPLSLYPLTQLSSRHSWSRKKQTQNNQQHEFVVTRPSMLSSSIMVRQLSTSYQPSMSCGMPWYI